MSVMTDEMLMAYADSQLDPQQTAQVEAYLADNPHARLLVDQLRENTRLTEAAFDAPMHSPPPPKLVAAIMGGDHGKRSREAVAENGSDVVNFAAGRARLHPAVGQSWITAAAACLAIIVSMTFGYVIGKQTNRASPSTEIALGAVAKGSMLERILETAASGKIEQAAGSQSEQRPAIKIVSTYRVPGDAVCREVEILRDARTMTPISNGLACRRSIGGWTVEGAVRVGSSDRLVGSGYKPSGASAGDPLDSVLQMVGAGQAISASEERLLIERGWKP
jgi:hypothetical protein